MNGIGHIYTLMAVSGLISMTMLINIVGGEWVNQHDDVNKHVDMQNIASFCLSLSKDMLSLLDILCSSIYEI